MRLQFQLTIDDFSGPLDLLLQLIERAELDIAKVSLANVTDSFLGHLAAIEERRPEEMAEFLVIATKLLYIKSAALLPDPPTEEDAGLDLEKQLRLYRDFYAASKHIDMLWQRDERLFLREKGYVLEERRGFQPPPNVTAVVLAEAFRGVLAKLAAFRKLPESEVRRVVTLAEKMRELERVIQEREELLWSEFVAHPESRSDVVVGFLALLELVKQQVVQVEQEAAFCDMRIKKTKQDASEQ